MTASRGVMLMLAMMALVPCRATYEWEKEEDPLNSCMDKQKIVCSDKGSCVDGVCRCSNSFDYGNLCQHTLLGRCPDLKPCVQCMAFNTGPIDHWDCDETCTVNTDIDGFRIVRILPLDEIMCSYRDEDGCRFSFSYAFSDYGGDKLTVKIHRQKEYFIVTAGLTLTANIFYPDHWVSAQIKTTTPSILATPDDKLLVAVSNPPQGLSVIKLTQLTDVVPMHQISESVQSMALLNDGNVVVTYGEYAEAAKILDLGDGNGEETHIVRTIRFGF